MSPEEIAQLREARYNATVVDRVDVNSELMKLKIRPDFVIPPHLPGQYCSLGLGYWELRTAGCQPESLKPEEERKLVLRAYSLSHHILDREDQLAEPAGELEFYIVLVRENPDGRVPALTPRLFNLRIGDRLKVFEKITGGYTLEPVKPDDTVVFLSTGTGEAPHNHMVWELLRRGHRGPIAAACCVRKNVDLGYLATHRAVEKSWPQYRYLPLVTREPGVPKRYVQDLISSGELDRLTDGRFQPERSHVYLCGNPSMIGVPTVDRDTGERRYPAPTGVIELLEHRGFRADHKATKFVGSIHFEEYW